MRALVLIAVFATLPAVAEAGPRVLATGDSMVQPLDEQLVRPVKRAGGHVRRDPRPGTGITKPLELDWLKHAKRQAKRHRPRATVVFLGANDAEPLRSASGPKVECCRRAWIDAYAERVARMMRSYRRGGAGYVYWLTLPTPRGDTQARRTAAINLALAQAHATADAKRVRLVDTIPALSPGNRYRRKVRYRGRTVVVRGRDGVHLTAAGARIARDLVVRAMRRDGVL
jgi:hypothetical protein